MEHSILGIPGTYTNLPGNQRLTNIISCEDALWTVTSQVEKNLNLNLNLKKASISVPPGKKWSPASGKDAAAAVPTPCYLRYAGIGFAVLASIVFSLGTVIVKEIQDYHALNISTWRFQGVLLPAVLVILYTKLFRKNDDIFAALVPLSKPGAKRTWGILFLRGAVGCGAVIFQILSLQYLDIADSSVICFSTPVFVSYLSHCFLGEKLGIVPVTVSLFTLLGVVIITRPPFLTGADLDLNTIIGAAMAFASMCFSAMIFIILRLLGGVPNPIVLSAFGLIGSIICIVVAAGLDCLQLPLTQTDWFLAVALGLLTFVGQVFFTLALKYEQAGLIALIRTGDVVAAFLWQGIIYQMVPDLFSVIGALIVVTGVVVITARKWISTLSDDSPVKQKCWIILK